MRPRTRGCSHPSKTILQAGANEGCSERLRIASIPTHPNCGFNKQPNRARTERTEAHARVTRTQTNLCAFLGQTRWGGKGRCDIMHYHVSPFGQYDGTWQEAEDAYSKILRESEPISFITVMREPRNHLLRYVDVCVLKEGCAKVL